MKASSPKATSLIASGEYRVKYHSDQKSRWSSRNAPCRGRKGDDPRGTVLVEDHGPLLARHRRFFLPHSSSSSRFTAGAVAFFILSQSGERPEWSRASQSF